MMMSGALLDQLSLVVCEKHDRNKEQWQTEAAHIDNYEFLYVTHVYREVLS